MKRSTLFVGVLLAASPVCAAPPAPESLAGLADAVSPALVQVAYHLQYAAGESPGEVDSWRTWRETTYRFEHDWEDWDQLVREERPALRGGFLIDPTVVVTGDLMIDPRFVRAVTVRYGDREVAAVPGAYGAIEDAVFLHLAEPLPAAKPLVFDSAAPAPYHAISYGRWDGAWRISVSPLPGSIAVLSDGRRYRNAPSHSLLVDSGGAAVGMTNLGRLPLDGSWRGSPQQWPVVTAQELAGVESRIGRRADGGLLHVALSFRSPRGGASDFEAWGGEPFADDNATEWTGLGVLAGDDLLLVLANLKPSKTARLERIRITVPGGGVRGATFVGSLEDYGGFLARLDTPLTGAMPWSAASIDTLRNQLLVKVRIAVYGDSRVATFGRERIMFCYTGWRGQIFPAVAATTPIGGFYYGTGAEALNFLFSTGGELVALPLVRREKVTVDEAWDEGAVMTPAAPLAAVLGRYEDHLDAANRPLPPDEENRLAWLGVELQPMDPDLARANGVEDQTIGGITGAIVTYVYSGSPAGDGGVRVGDILLRLHVEGHPRPLAVDASEDPAGMMSAFPWEYFDEVPEEYFEQLPAPWGSVENALTRSLTDLGEGTRYRAEVFRDGATITMDFSVTRGPPHYEAAKHVKSEDLGLTVRDLTYEVRRYFHMGPDDPGVIVSKIEPGGKAAVAGLKPYEIITSVGDRRIAGVGEFARAVGTPGEHRLLVKRMAEGRIVRLRSDE